MVRRLESEYRPALWPTRLEVTPENRVRFLQLALRQLRDFTIIEDDAGVMGCLRDGCAIFKMVIQVRLSKRRRETQRSAL